MVRPWSQTVTIQQELQNTSNRSSNKLRRLRGGTDKLDNVCGKKNSYVLIGDTLIGGDELMAALHNYIKSIRDSNILEAFRQEIFTVMQETNKQALSIRSMAAGEQELRDGICNYVLSIDHDQALEKHWVVSSKPYPIALSLKTIQGILTKGQPITNEYRLFQPRSTKGCL